MRRFAGRTPLSLLGALVVGAAAPACDCQGGEPVGSFSARLRITPQTLDFGALPLGAASTRTVVVVNDGNGPWSPERAPAVEGSDAAAFSLASCALPLVGGAACNLDVTFRPDGERPFTAELSLLDEAGAVRIVPLAGAGEPSPLAFDPAALDFGSLDVGDTDVRSVAIGNEGGAPLSFTLRVDAPGFLLGGADRVQLSLAAGATTNVDVAFGPSRGGEHAARLIAETCGAGCGPSIPLRGTGRAPRIDVAPRALDLGEVEVGAFADGAVEVVNIGVGDLVVTGARVVDGSGAASLATTLDLPLSLSAGERASVSVRYAPTAPDGAFAATLLLSSNDPLSPEVAVPVGAVTPGAALQAIPQALHFGVLDPGDEVTATAVVRSIGTAPAVLSAVVVDGPPAFALVDPVPGLPRPLLPGESVLVVVRARADDAAVAAGGASATLRFDGDGVEDALTALTFASGLSGCQPRARVPNADLGGVRVGQGRTGSVFVENVGTGACALQDARPAPGLPFDDGFVFGAQGVAALQPGATGRVDFGFTADGEGESRAFVELTFAEQPAPLLVSATARGVAGSLVAEPPLVTFGPAPESCPLGDRRVGFVNDGAGDVHIASIVLDPVDAPFTLLVPALPAVVPAGGSFGLRARAHDVPPGSYEARVRATTEESIDAAAQVRLVVEPAGTAVTETFQAQSISMVDVLFVVDDSGSMFDDQVILADNFGSFIDAAFQGGTPVDFHIGVTTTDVLSDDALNGRLRGPPRVLTASTPALEATFADHARVGTLGAGLELGLEAMRRALDEPHASGANAGFLRPEAALSVIVVTDEDDAGEDPFLVEFAPEAARPVDSYVSFLRALKGGVLASAPVLFSAVRNPQSSVRYDAVADEMGGMLLDIGDPTWGDDLATLGLATFELQRLFRLSNEPQPGTVTVTVDGAQTDSFTVDAEGRAVVLDEQPPAGAVVVVTYHPACGP